MFLAPCNIGWTEARISEENKCFKNIGEFPFSQAVSKCTELGAELPLPLNKQEDTDLYKVIESFGLTQAALDGIDVTKEGVWRRSNGDQLTYFNWAKTQPNNWNGQQDFLSYYKDGSGKWGDYEPFKVVNIVCQESTTGKA